MKKNSKKRLLSIVLSLALAISTPSFTNLGNITTYAATATNGIVKGSDTPGVESSFITTLNSGESVSLKIVDSILTIKVDASEYNFQIGNIAKTTDAAVVNEKDGLLHILTLGGLYYVFDLYTGVQIVAYRNSINGKYCSKRNSYAYEVYGKSLINNTYFYELLTSNSVSRELLMTRGEFDIIVNGGDPSLDDETEKPAETPTVAPTEKPTEVPTVAPTEKPTEAPTVAPTEKPTEEPTQTPIEKPTETSTVDLTEEATTTVIKTEFNFDFWWKQYINGIINWEQLTEVMWEHQWKANSETTEKSTTYYFYDDEGKLIRIETVTNSNSTQSGTGSGSATVNTSGKAEVDMNVDGEGGGNGNITVNVTNKVPNSEISAKSTSPYINVKKLTLYVGQTKTLKLYAANSKVTWKRGNKKVTLGSPYGSNSCKVKIKGKKVGKVTVTATCNGKKYKCIVTVKSRRARVTTYKNTRRIYSGKNRLYGTLYFNRKTGVLKYRGYKVSGVTDGGFIKGTYNVVFIKNGKLYWIPKNAPKGSFKHKKLIKCNETVVALQRNTYGFVTNARTISGCVKNVSNK